jgi:hypothetical protein
MTAFVASTGEPAVVAMLVLGGVFGLLALSRGWRVARLHANHERLEVENSRRDWRRVRLAAPDVEQIFCIEEVDEDEDRTYHVCARDRWGKDHELAVVHEPEQAWWLEERLESHLGIRDRIIDGAHRRKALPE